MAANESEIEDGLAVREGEAEEFIREWMLEASRITEGESVVLIMPRPLSVFVTVVVRPDGGVVSKTGG